LKGYLISLFLVLFLFVPSLFAQQAKFDEATLLLEDQEFRQAITIYSSIADEGHSSGALWLNLGIAYAQLDSLGKAKFYLLRAERFPETKQLAEEALAYVNERFNRRSAVLPPLPWDRFTDYLIISVGINTLFFITFFFLYTGSFSLIASWFIRRYKRSLFYFGLTSLFISALILSTALYADYQNNRFGTGVITERQIPVYEQPATDASLVSTAFEGYTLKVDLNQSSDVPGWKYVRLENGRYGWVTNDALMVF
jgi:tetratricopeptide (TPR) repeat protein